MRRRASSEQTTRGDGELTWLSQRGYQWDNVEANHGDGRCRRDSKLIALLAKLTMLGAEVGVSRIELACHPFTVAGHHHVFCRRCLRWAGICGDAPLREQQRKDRDRDNTHTYETINSHGVQIRLTAMDESYKKSFRRDTK